MTGDGVRVVLVETQQIARTAGSSSDASTSSGCPARRDARHDAVDRLPRDRVPARSHLPPPRRRGPPTGSTIVAASLEGAPVIGTALAAVVASVVTTPLSTALFATLASTADRRTGRYGDRRDRATDLNPDRTAGAILSTRGRLTAIFPITASIRRSTVALSFGTVGAVSAEVPTITTASDTAIPFIQNTRGPGVLGPPFGNGCSAVSYSPTPCRVQYHRRWRA